MVVLTLASSWIMSGVIPSGRTVPGEGGGVLVSFARTSRWKSYAASSRCSAERSRCGDLAGEERRLDLRLDGGVLIAKRVGSEQGFSAFLLMGGADDSWTGEALPEGISTGTEVSFLSRAPITHGPVRWVGEAFFFGLPRGVAGPFFGGILSCGDHHKGSQLHHFGES